MRITCTLLLFACLPNLLSAQEIAVPSRTHEIGLNATSLFREFINFNSDPVFIVPYHLTYKHLDANGKGFRMGIGLDISRSKEEADNSNFTDNKNAFANINLRMGWQKQWQLGKKWGLVFGWDGLAGYRHFEISTLDTFDEVKLETNRFQAGVGPALGMQFMIGERVGLATEANLYLIQTFSKTKETSNGGGSNDEDKSNSTSLSLSLPVNLFIFMRI